MQFVGQMVFTTSWLVRLEKQRDRKSIYVRKWSNCAIWQPCKLVQIAASYATPPGGKAFKNISTYFFAKGKNERGHKEIMALSFLVVLLLNVLFQSHESLE